MATLDELSVHLSAHLYGDCSTSDMVGIAELAHDSGFDRIFISDNLGARNPFVILSAIASRVSIGIGTAVVVPYFRNPLDVASSLAAITELAQGSEVSFGIARGSHLQTSRRVQVVRPLLMLRETSLFLKELLSGGEVRFDDYPTLLSYFNMRPSGSSKLDFLPKMPVKIYCGGNGPRTLAVAGEVTDGLIFGGQFIPFLLTNRIPGLLSISDKAAERANPRKRMERIGLIAVSIAGDAKAARAFPRSNVASSMISLRIMGFTDDDFRMMGVDPSSVDRLTEAQRMDLPADEVVKFVTDEMVDATYVAGDAESCRERFVELCEAARKSGIRRIGFSKLGPDPKASVAAISNKILPAVR